MKRHLLIAALCAIGPSVHARTTAFDYDIARALPPGTVLHYTKSARDGSKPWNIDLYVASPTRVDVVKWAPGAGDFVEVAADLDIAHAMPVNMQQWNSTANGREPRLYGNVTADALQIKLHNGMQIALPLGGQPLHLWGFDLMGIATLLPHLADPDQPFELEIADPNQPGSDGRPVAQSVVRFEPAGDDTIDGAACRKYRIAGEVFGDQIGWLWVNRETGRIERAEHPVPTSTDWADWKLDYTGSEQLDGLAWEGFKLELAAQLSGGGAGKSLASDMQRVHAEGGVAALLAGIPGWRERSLKGLEGDLNTFGYTLLGAGKQDDAIALFERITQEFPRSANAWDSLGEALAEAGRREQALASYRMALELDPANTHAREQIARLAAANP